MESVMNSFMEKNICDTDCEVEMNFLCSHSWKAYGSSKMPQVNQNILYEASLRI